MFQVADALTTSQGCPVDHGDCTMTIGERGPVPLQVLCVCTCMCVYVCACVYVCVCARMRASLDYLFINTGFYFLGFDVSFRPRENSRESCPCQRSRYMTCLPREHQSRNLVVTELSWWLCW